MDFILTCATERFGLQWQPVMKPIWILGEKEPRRPDIEPRPPATPPAEA